MTFVRTTAINRLRGLKKRIKVAQGGTWAGKTHGIIPILIDTAAREPNLKITIVNESIPAAKDGPVDIFKDVMQYTNRWRQAGWISNPLEYTFANNSRIQFKSFDSEGKAKASGKRDILFINEANHIPYKIADALLVRSKESWLDYNPDNEFYVHTEVLSHPSAELITLTFKDNQAITPEALEDLMFRKGKGFFDVALPDDKLLSPNNIKSKTWANWWKVYGMGLVGTIEGVIFTDWKQISRIPPNAKYVGSGMDFGYTNDPSTIIDVYQINGKYIFDEFLYRKGMLNNEIAKYAKSDGPNRLIYADSAEPKSIDEIRRHGVRILGAKKGKDSIAFGIDLLQQAPFYVTDGSINLIKELRRYVWETDREGNKTNSPIDSFNHGIDAMRYFAMSKMTHNRGHYVLR